MDKRNFEEGKIPYQISGGFAAHIYGSTRSVIIKFEGLELPLENPRSLAEYKKHLNGDHQIQDVKALEAFIENQ